MSVLSHCVINQIHIIKQCQNSVKTLTAATKKQKLTVQETQGDVT